MSPSMLKVNSNLLNLLCLIYFCFLVYIPKVTAGSLVWGLGVICCLPAFLPTHPLKIRSLKFLQSRKKRKKMTSMESKLYQLSVNRHTLEDFRFSCWGIFSQSEYTTPWGKKRVFPKLLDWSSQQSVKHKRAAKAKIDMCNWLWSQLGSSFHILPEPHHKLAGKTSLSDLIICAELQSNRLTSSALSVLLFPTTICQVLFTNLQTFDYV